MSYASDVSNAVFNIMMTYNVTTPKGIMIAISQAIYNERERCANLCETTPIAVPCDESEVTLEYLKPDPLHAGKSYAALIREGKK